MTFLLLLCIHLLISPSSKTEDDGSSSFIATWSTLPLFISTMVVLGLVSCIACSACVNYATFFITLCLIMIDVSLLYWRKVTVLGWVYWLVGFVAPIVLAAMGYMISTVPRKTSSRQHHDDYSYERPGRVASAREHLPYHVRHTPANTRPEPASNPAPAHVPTFPYNEAYAAYVPAAVRPRTPPNIAPAAVAMPPVENGHADVEPGRVTRRYEIEEGSTGHTYANIFKPYINAALTSVTVEEPWMHHGYQFDQLKDFLKAFVERASNLRSVSLLTQRANGENETEQTTRRARQERILTEIQRWMRSLGVDFHWDYEEFHDRWIRLDNGWEATIGRGLSFYHRQTGAHDRAFAVRRCRETSATFIPV